MPDIQINGARLYYIEKGQGKATIFFCHGLYFSQKMYEAQIEVLSQKYHCIAIDFRGQGQSEITESGYDMENLTLDIVEAIKKLVPKGNTCHFVGLSMGGFVGMRIAANHPSLINSLSLLNTSAAAEPFFKLIKYNALLLIATGFGMVKPVINGIEKAMYGKAFMKSPKGKETRLFWQKKWKTHPIKGLLEATKGVIKRDNFGANQLEKIKLPTLIIGGKEDKALPPSKSEFMHKHIPHAELHLLEGIGHSTCLEAPERLNWRD